VYLTQEEHSLQSWRKKDPKRLMEVLTEISDEEAEVLRYDWYGMWARENQTPPGGDWRTWLVLAGRGFGKTRCGAEFVRYMADTGQAKRMALVAPTAADARDIMIEGQSGILACYPPKDRPIYEPSKRRLTWGNGAIATAYAAETPDRLRGPQFDLAWADELAAWQYPEAWDMLMLGLRLGNPRVVVTTTPRPIKAIRDLLKSNTTAVTRGSTYDNKHNLAPMFLEKIISRYEGTRLGRQELYAEVLDDVPGALWQRHMIDDTRWEEPPELARVVVAIDPAVTSGDESDETGIIVAGKGLDGRGYVLADYSCRQSPDGWARVAVEAYHKHRADRIVAETNNGGDLVESVLRTVDRRIPYRKVTASRGKRVRAEPIAAMYEQEKISHIGVHELLEDQMCSFVADQPQESPDRVDALVWGLTELFPSTMETPVVKKPRGW